MSTPTCKILSTKQLPDTVLDKAAARGLCIECIPFIGTQYRDTGSIAADLGHVQPSDIFIFTSKHAIIAAQPVLAACGNDAYCISGSTSETLSALTKLKLAAEAPNAQLLCEQLLLDVGRNYIFCCGNRRLGTIPDHLAAYGIRCNEVICYDTELLTKKIEASYDAVLFFSPSAAESYFTLNNPYKHQHFYCIGATTAATVKKYTSQKVFVAKEPSVASLIFQIEQTETR